MLFRMSIRRSKSLIWALNITAIVGITLLFVAIYKKKEDKVFEASPWKVFETILEEGIGKDTIDTGNQVVDFNKYAALWNANISGIKKKVETAKVEDTGPVINQNPLEQILSVGTILLDPKVPENSRVRLHYLDAQDSNESTFKLQAWTKEGDALKYPYHDAPYHGKVLKISEEEVLFSFKGDEVKLKPDGAKVPDDLARNPDGSRFTPGAVRKKIKAPKETKEIAPGKWNLSLKEANYLRSDAGVNAELKLIKMTSFKNPATGKSELQLSVVKPGSLAAKRGFKVGDSLISINGYPVHNKAGAINYFKKHPNEGTYVVEILRNGTRIFKTFHAPKD